MNSAAGVINAALTQNRTAAGIALALESAGLLMSPEAAADLASVSTDAVERLEKAVAELKREHEISARLRARVAELEAERHVTNEALDNAVKALREPVEVHRPFVGWLLEVTESGVWLETGLTAETWDAAEDLLAREQTSRPELEFRLVCKRTTYTLPPVAGA